MLEFKIDNVKMEDLPAITNIYMDVYNELPLGEKWNYESAYEFLNEWYNTSKIIFLKATFENKIIGASFGNVVTWWDGKHLTNVELFVLPSYQHHGVGKSLLKRLCQEGVNIYCAKIFDARTYKTSPFPLSWYKAIGITTSRTHVIIEGNIQDILKHL